MQWCEKKLQMRADQQALSRQPLCKQKEGAFKGVYDQMARAHKTDAECDDMDRAHRVRWGEPNSLGAGTPWPMEADMQWRQVRLQQKNSHRNVLRAA